MRRAPSRGRCSRLARRPVQETATPACSFGYPRCAELGHLGAAVSGTVSETQRLVPLWLPGFAADLGAGVAKLANATVSHTVGRKPLWVDLRAGFARARSAAQRLPPPAPPRLTRRTAERTMGLRCAKPRSQFAAQRAEEHDAPRLLLCRMKNAVENETFPKPSQACGKESRNSNGGREIRTPKGLLPAVFKFLRGFCFSLLSFAYRCRFAPLDARASAFLCFLLQPFAGKPSHEPSQPVASASR